MPITLQRPDSFESYTKDAWEQKCLEERYAGLSDELNGLNEVLRELFETHRAAFEKRIERSMLDRLEAYTKGRESNETATAYYSRMRPFQENVSWNESWWEKERRQGRWRQAIDESAQLIYDYTNHPTTWKYRFSVEENFNVRINRKKVKAGAVDATERAIRNSVYKVQSKIVDILLAGGKHTCVLDSCTFSRGTFEGWMTIKFASGNHFRFHLQIVHANGVQYRFNFHDVVYDGKKKGKLLAEAGIRRLFGVEKWKVPKQPKRRWFDKLKTGDIVRLEDDSIALVIGQRGGKAKVWHPDTDEQEVAGDDLSEVLFRTTARDSFKGNHRVYLDGANGEKIKYEIPPVENDRGISYIKVMARIRREGFVRYIEEK
jgi:hypothetical protein